LEESQHVLPIEVVKASCSSLLRPLLRRDADSDHHSGCNADSGSGSGTGPGAVFRDPAAGVAADGLASRLLPETNSDHCCSGAVAVGDMALEQVDTLVVDCVDIADSDLDTHPVVVVVVVVVAQAWKAC
jgi:hypothetical protein